MAIEPLDMASAALPQLARKQLLCLVSRQAHIGVIGLGYVGLPLSLLFASAGYKVTGFEIDEGKIAAIACGKSYILRISDKEIGAARQQGFSATSDFSQLVEQDAVIICVPTPLTNNRQPDLSFIETTARLVSPWLQRGQLVVLESTSYPGTTADILIPLLTAGGHSLHVQEPCVPSSDSVFYVAFSPEREDPGNTEVARRHIPKIVGGHDPIAAKLAAALYENIFDCVVQVSSTRAAEMTKLLENVYRCVNIALINELKMLCMRMGIDIWEVIEAASSKPFGFQAFYPGPGLGGHCIPIDPVFLSWKAREYGFRTRFIELAGEVNEAMPHFVVDQVIKALKAVHKSLNGSRVLVLGLSYKRDIDDLRESPSLSLMRLMRDGGADVAFNDPYHSHISSGPHYELDLSSTPLDQLEEFDCTLIATDHSVYDYTDIVRRSKLVIDTRNATHGLSAAHIHRC